MTLGPTRQRGAIDGLTRRATVVAHAWRALIGAGRDAPDRLIGALKKRCIGLGVAIKKSELLRAGLAVLERLPDEGLAKVVAGVESVKTGRPPGTKKKKKTNRAKRKKQVIRIDWR